jgi:lipopolysaccharide transport system permease protein
MARLSSIKNNNSFNNVVSKSCTATVIEPSQGWGTLNWGELWEYRELLYFLIWRDIKVRYKQTILGAIWAIIQPLFTMIIFSFFFGKLAKVPSDGIPYPIFAYVALLPWTFFANGLNQASNSLVGSSSLITKIYFPRLMIPLASVLSGLMDFAIAFIMLLGFIFVYKIQLVAAVIWLPLFLLLTLITTFGVALWLSALNVQYRDIRYAVPFLTQCWLFSTPIAYSSSLLNEPLRTLYSLNPMVGVVEGFRWALLGSNTTTGLMLILSALAALMLLVSGIFYFQRMEQVFADVI